MFYIPDNQRKIVQITACEAEDNPYTVVALCDDGTLWEGTHVSGCWEWSQLPAIPAPPAAPAAPAVKESYVVICRGDRRSEDDPPAPYELASRRVFDIREDAVIFAAAFASGREPLVVEGRWHQLRLK